VIPDTASLGGTVRTFDPEVRDIAERRINEICAGLGEATGAEIAVTYDRGYPATINDARAVEIVREAAREVVGEERLIAPPPKMAGEDFSYFLQERRERCSRWEHGMSTVGSCGATITRSSISMRTRW
jgi:metal-dependent amidase/aminoacylase/carboxypeptidase family protein